MNTTTRISGAERLGRSFGRGWLAYVRGEQRVLNWLVTREVPPTAAAASMWAVKLAALGILLYAAFWLTLLLAFVLVAAWMARNTVSDNEPPDPKWQNGPAGFGLYTYDGFRVDPHAEDDY